MNIVACVKRVPSTDAQVKVASDGKHLDRTGLQYMISFYDEIAVEEAVKTKEALGGEVTVRLCTFRREAFSHREPWLRVKLHMAPPALFFPSRVFVPDIVLGKL